MLYLVLGLPILLIFAFFSLIALLGARPGNEQKEAIEFFAIFWTPLALSFIYLFVTFRVKKILIQKILDSIKSRDIFLPDEGNEFLLANNGKYLGIDSRNGTILYIHRIRKGQVDVVGLSMGEWTNREIEGNKLRLYTKFPDLPCIEISTPWAQRWYDTLGAMEYKRYNTHKPFNEYVRDHVDLLEREHQIHIPKLA